MNEEKKPVMAMAIITLLAIGGLVVLFDNSTDNGVTGALSGQQTAYSRIYGLKYNYNPCGLLTCKGGQGIQTGVDAATGNLLCKCPGQKFSYYQISSWRKR